MTVLLKKVEYYKLVTPPTLDQFLVRKKIKEVSAESRGMIGVTRYKGKLMPKSAAITKQRMIGYDAESIKKEHPEWVKEYPEFVKIFKDSLKE